MKALIISAALLLAGCHFKTVEEIAAGPNMGVAPQACAAAEIGIRRDMHLPAETFPPDNWGFYCDDPLIHSPDNREFTVAMKVHQTDARGHDVGKGYTFYVVKTKIQASGAMRAVDLSHADGLEDWWKLVKVAQK